MKNFKPIVRNIHRTLSNLFYLYILPIIYFSFFPPPSFSVLKNFTLFFKVLGFHLMIYAISGLVVKEHHSLRRIYLDDIKKDWKILLRPIKRQGVYAFFLNLLILLIGVAILVLGVK